MKPHWMSLWAAGFLAFGFGATTAVGQSKVDTVDAHRAAARAAAGQDLTGLLHRVCPDTPPAAAPAPQNQAQAPAQRADPPRDQWHREPVKVFDNLYFVGTQIHGAWAVTTSQGIIVIDALYNYAVEDEVAGGLRRLGLDPRQIKYVVVSHGHGDHHGGAKFLQDQFGAHIIMSAADWDLVERDTRNPKPRRDMVATDGQKLTLGDTTLTMYITPGHTPGTISTLVPVKDAGKAHLAAEWGGTAFSSATPIEQIRAYITSAARFRDLAATADVLITNHTEFDGALAKLAAEEKRKPGEANPYVVGSDTVKRYLTVAEECAKAELVARGGIPSR
jgi:metallo-beta-lactamase class B